MLIIKKIDSNGNVIDISSELKEIYPKTVDEMFDQYLTSFKRFNATLEQLIEDVYKYISLQVPNDLLFLLKSKENLPSKHDLMFIRYISIEIATRVKPKYIDEYNQILTIYKDRK